MYIFELTSLPDLGELGTTPPLTGRALLDRLESAPRPQAQVRALWLHDDLLQREAWLAGEIESVDPLVLTVAQARNEAPLPAYLEPAEPVVPRPQADLLWEAYFRHVAGLAERTASQFLAAWVGAEVALRNALAGARARNLGLEPSDYVVAEDLADPSLEVDDVVGRWATAPHPLEGWRVLIRWRWDWARAHDAWFTFGDDELAAYGAKLMLLVRWHRLDEADPARHPRG